MASAETAMATGSKMPVAYFVALARASTTPAVTSRARRARGPDPADRTPSQVATVTIMSAIAS